MTANNKRAKKQMKKREINKNKSSLFNQTNSQPTTNNGHPTASSDNGHEVVDIKGW